MKKYLFIAAVALLTFSSCKKQETAEADASMTTDSIEQQDTTNMVTDTTVIDTTSADATTSEGSDVELLNKMSTKTTSKNVDGTKGKYALSETKWKLVELNGKAVKSKTGKDYFINLDSKSGKFAANVGCNTISGTYFMKDETKLGFNKIMATKMACPNFNFESDFVKVLEKVDNYMIEGKMLHFHKTKAALAKFEAVR